MFYLGECVIYCIQKLFKTFFVSQKEKVQEPTRTEQDNNASQDQETNLRLQQPQRERGLSRLLRLGDENGEK